MFSLDLNIFSWNYRGLSNLNTMNRIKDLMEKKHPDFICLVKTKTNPSRIQCFYSHLKCNWEWTAVPSTGLFGGILVLWNASVGKVTPVAISRLALHMVISSNNKTWILTTIYNSQVISAHKRFWRSLLKISLLEFP